MKKIFAPLLAIVFLAGSLTSKAQADLATPSIPKWTSEKGYWVVESNKKTPKDAVVYFYNNDHMMVYKEEINCKKIKLNRKKTLLHLKVVLEEAVTSYEKGNWAHQDSRLTRLLEE